MLPLQHIALYQRFPPEGHILLTLTFDRGNGGREIGELGLAEALAGADRAGATRRYAQPPGTPLGPGGFLEGAALDAVAVPDVLLFPKTSPSVKLAAFADPRAGLLAWDLLAADVLYAPADAVAPLSPEPPLSIHRAGHSRVADVGPKGFADTEGAPVLGHRVITRPLFSGLAQAAGHRAGTHSAPWPPAPSHWAGWQAAAHPLVIG